jgi:serine/threonine protein kinase
VKLLYNREPDSQSMQFQNEFDNLMKLEHTNIVRLMGYCYETKHVATPYNGNIVLAEKATRALILEYLHNGSLERHLSASMVFLHPSFELFLFEKDLVLLCSYILWFVQLQRVLQLYRLQAMLEIRAHIIT